MMRVRSVSAAAVAAAVLVLVTTSAWCQPFDAGQQVEVREGEKWSPGVILKVEGRQHEVEYSDGSGFKEWVTADRLRPAGGGAAPASPSKPEASPPTFKQPQWRRGQKVEVKWGGLWRDATIRDKRNQWWQVAYSEHNREWVEPWRIREPGSPYDTEYASPNHGDDPPRTPPGPAPLAKGAADAADVAQALADEPGYRAPDRSQARSLPLRLTSRTWQFTPDPYPGEGRQKLRPTPLRRPDSELTPRTIRGSRSASNVVCVLSAEDDGGSPWLDRLDIARGAVLDSTALGEARAHRLADVSPDGQRILLVEDTGAGFGNRNLLEVWSFSNGKPTRDLLLIPFAGESLFHKDIHFAAFADNEHLLIAGGEKELALWEIATGRVVWSTPCRLDGWGDLAADLSPGNRYLAYNAGNEILIIEARTGDLVAELPEAVGSATAVAFSPGGAQLMAINRGSVVAVDLTTGQVRSTVSLPGTRSPSTVACPADDWALIDGTLLMDMDRLVPAWSFKRPADAAAAVLPSGLYAFAVESDGRVATHLLGENLPTPEAVAAANGVSRDEVMLLQPGTPVQVVLSASMDQAHRERVMQHITEQARQHGYAIVENAPVQLVLKREKGKSEKRDYERHEGMGRFRVESVNVQTHVESVAIVADGQTVWERAATVGDPGSHVSLRQGESVQGIANRQAGNHSPLFTRFDLPPYLLKNRDPLAAGESELTDRGLR